LKRKKKTLTCAVSETSGKTSGWSGKLETLFFHSSTGAAEMEKPALEIEKPTAAAAIPEPRDSDLQSSEAKSTTAGERNQRQRRAK